MALLEQEAIRLAESLDDMGASRASPMNGRVGVARSLVAMTLVLSAHKRDVVFQVADRLTSAAFPRGRLEPLDVLTNKTVVYLATDAVVAIGFSGRARLGGRRVDLWIAEKLTGMDFEDEGSIVFFVGGRGSEDIFHSWQLLRDEAERAFHAIRHEKHLQHTFVMVGWQRRRRGQAQPMLWRMDNRADEPAHFQHRDLLRDVPDWLHQISLTPVGTYSEPEMDALLARLRGAHSRVTFETELVDAIRATSDKLPGVGKDCVAVQLHPSEQPTVRVRYMPRSGPPIFSHKAQGKALNLPFVFSPWIIGDGALMPPNLIVGHPGRFDVGGLSCSFEAPLVVGGVDYGMSMHDVSSVRKALYGRP